MSSAQPPRGVSGRLAGMFIRSKLTGVVILLSLVCGAIAVLATPREEDPSITVTAADVLVAYPGQGAATVDERVVRPVYAWLREIPTVEHVASSAGEDGALFVVQFQEGVEREPALTSLYDRLQANADQLPPGALPPLVKPRGVDDVPVLAATLWSERDDPLELRRVAAELAEDVRDVPNVSRVELIGGQRRAIRVELDAQRMADVGVAADRVVQSIQAANLRLPAGSLAGPEGAFRVEAGAFLTSAADVESLIVGANAGGLIYLRDVARVQDGALDSTEYVTHLGRETGWSAHPAVTLTATKVRGSNGSDVTQEIRRTLDRCAGRYLSADVHLSIVRDSGLTASRRVNTMLEHMGLATAIVVVLILFALGRREAVIMAILIPVMLAIVPVAYKLTGYTLNRITLAAMIFVIGFLVDNAIVVMENIHRRFQESAGDREKLAIEAVAEIGGPTILATFMIIVALAPTAFVTGMAGQFLRALPVGASIAMAYSLLIALTVAPYLSRRLLAGETPHPRDAAPRPSRYRRALDWILAAPGRTKAVYGVCVVLFVAVMLLIPTRVVVFRLFPLVDSDEMSVVIDLPPESTLEESNATVVDLARRLQTIPQVVACQTYVGAPAPATFQSVGRHYILRREPYQAEIHIRLPPDNERSVRSHDVALQVRQIAARFLNGSGATFTVAEPPPGPPVQATVVAEVYGPDDAGRLALAKQVRAAFAAYPDLVDVDWSARPGAPVLRYEVESAKAAARGVVAAQAAAAFRALVSGDAQNWARHPREREPVPIAARLAPAARAVPGDLESLRFTSMIPGASVPATDIGRLERREGTFPLSRLDGRPLISVTADSIGKGPIYASLDLAKKIRRLTGPDGRRVEVLWRTDRPPPPDRYCVRWSGEWTQTYETMIRDLGVAFAVVLFLIYLILAAWYDSFSTPLVLMLPIPFILIGVIPGHVLFGFSLGGVGTIGVIALAGIMVRNSILLVDFARSHIKQGMPIKEAVLCAAQLRLRPIVLTSATVILGDGVLYFDPLLQGMGVTMSIGPLVSTVLTLVLVPIAYCQLATYRQRRGRAV